MKVCDTCGKEKNSDCFNKSNSTKDGLYHKCKECRSIETKSKRYPISVTEKQCTKCKQIKLANEFHRAIGNSTGLSSHCKECKNESDRNRDISVSVTEKKCNKCGNIKPSEQFDRAKSKKYGLYGICKACKKERSDKRNFKVIITEKVCPRCNILKLSNLFHKNRGNKDGLQTYCKNCDSIYEKQHSSTEASKISAKKSKIKWRDSGKLALYFNDKYNNNVQFKIKHLLRCKVRTALKGKSKSDHTINLIGCGFDQFKQHIESQFKEGMSWDNYGKGWQLDHKVPCAYFDLTIKENQFICFNFRNFQPLFCYENRTTKRAAIPENADIIIQEIKNQINL